MKDKTVGIIAEYNPFHKGHEYHIRRSKEMTGAKYCIAVMSGDYVQRGQAALVNKYERTKWALDHGADLVLELPVPLCCASAEYFAKGGVRILNDTGCTDFLSFGSECGDIDTLSKISGILKNENDGFKETMQNGLKNGLSYPAARAAALEDIVKSDTSLSLDPAGAVKILDNPNNVLAMEYLDAIAHFSSAIKPVTVKRQGAAYGDDSMEIAGTDFASATAVRKALKDMGPADAVSSALPNDVYEALKTSPMLFDDDISGFIHYRLLTATNTKCDYTSYAEISRELSNRIENNLSAYTVLGEFIELLKTRNYTYSRISRALLNIMLDVYGFDLDGLKRMDYGTGYATLLGFRKEAGELLSEIKEKGKLKLITRRADIAEISDSKIRRYVEMNLCASDIYDCIIKSKYGSDPKSHAYDTHNAFSPVIL